MCTSAGPDKGIEGADEDDERLLQILIILSFLRFIHIDHSLVVAGAFGELAVRAIGTLHLDVVDAPRLIMHIDIEPHTLAVIVHIDRLFCFRERNLRNADMENFLDQLLTDPLVPHDLLKKEIIANREFFPRLDSRQGHHHLSSIPIL